MKLLIIFLISLSLFFPSFAEEELIAANINLQGQVPRAEFESTTVDFGNIYRGQTVSHRFFFKNTGNGTLVLGNIFAPCGCIHTQVTTKDGKTSKNIFKPHEAGRFQVDFNSSAFSGNVTRDVTVETNMGSSRPTITFHLKAMVFQEMSSNPDLLYVGRINKGDTKSFFVELNTFKNNIDVYDVESSNPHIQADLTTDNHGKSSIHVTVNTQSFPNGAFHAHLIVHNSSQFNQKFVIPIVGEIASPVQISEKFLEFGIVKEEKFSEKNLTITSYDSDFDLTSVLIDSKKIHEIQSLKNSDLFEVKKQRISYSQSASNKTAANFGYKVTVRLFFPKKAKWAFENTTVRAVNVSGNFVIKTNNPDYKEITVPFFGVLRKNSYD